MKIRDIRRELRLSQAEFARLLGVHQTAVSQWETGRTSPEIEIVKRISRLSGHMVGEVLDVPESPVQKEGTLNSLEAPEDIVKDARFRPGDTLYIRPTDHLPPIDLVAVQTSAGLMVRWCVSDGTTVSLIKELPSGARETVTPDMKILGSICAFYSRI